MIAVVAALAGTAAGCGGSGGHASAQATATSSASVPGPALSGVSPANRRAVLTAVNGYYSALQAHRGAQACSQLTRAAQRRIVAQITARTSHFGHTCQQILGNVGLLLSGQVHVLSGSVGTSSARLVIQGKSRGSMTLTKSSGHWQISGTS